VLIYIPGSLEEAKVPGKHLLNSRGRRKELLELETIGITLVSKSDILWFSFWNVCVRRVFRGLAHKKNLADK
jgi:hypothetical protein